MKPLRTDLSIFSKFNFEKPPVGVKFLFTRPDGIEQLDGALPICEMIKEAQQRGKPFFIGQENEDCFGTVILGMEGTPTYAESGQLGDRFEIFEEARANSRLYQYVPKFARGTVNYVAFAPLDKLTFEPDLLILMTTPGQAEIVLRAMSYKTGEIWESKKTPVMGCAWIYAYPYKSGKVNHMITGMSFGMIAKQIYPEGRIVISIPWDWIATIAGNLGEMKWTLPSYTDGRDKFIEREQRYIDELEQVSQNP